MSDKIKPKDYFKDANNQIISRFWDAEKGGFFPNEKLKLAPYIPNDDLIDLVRLAQVLERPILIKGEPGSGKTQLAKSVAYEWYGPKYKDYYFEWNIKSTSKAIDGIYTFDHVGRLRESQLDDNFDLNTEDKTKFREYGEFAKAIKKSTAEKPAILLIDEIDKADVDFPNDLLLELDENRFKIPETKETVVAKHPPLIFITSNAEREMPNAFLRRCLFAWLDFPKDDTLNAIIQAHIPNLAKDHESFVKEAVALFNTIRENIALTPAESKNVSTGELLKWLKGFDWLNEDTETMKASLIDESGRPRFYPALFKTWFSFKQGKTLSEKITK